MAAGVDDQQLKAFVTEVLGPRLIALNEMRDALLDEYKRMVVEYPWLFNIAAREEICGVKAQLAAVDKKRVLLLDQFFFSIRRELGQETKDTWDTKHNRRVDVDFNLRLVRRAICAADVNDMEALRAQYIQ